VGLFHCPMGAAFYDDEDCIDCGMCSAVTKEEMVEASKKIRAYLQSRAVNSGPVKKIAVCGKGGVGKSTLVTLIANVLSDEDYNVLVMDTDESNPGLYRMFDFTEQPRPLIRLLSRFSEGEPEPDTEWITQDEIAVEDIPSNFILNRNGLKFLMVGKIDDPFQGCACTMSDITRDLMEKLVVDDKEIVLVDMEAGVESFGRGLERSVDTILVIVEPSFESMALAEKMRYMAEGMGISRIQAILNKVPTEKTAQKMTDELNKRNVRTIGTVYLDPLVSEAGFEGRAPGESPAKEAVRAIIKQLLTDTQ